MWEQISQISLSMLLLLPSISKTNPCSNNFNSTYYSLSPHTHKIVNCAFAALYFSNKNLGMHSQPSPHNTLFVPLHDTVDHEKMQTLWKILMFSICMLRMLSGLFLFWILLSGMSNMVIPLEMMILEMLI